MRTQDLADAVFSGSDPEDILDLLLATARHDFGARTALIVLPTSLEQWAVELVDGAEQSELWGCEIDPESELGHALQARDIDTLEGLTTLHLSADIEDHSAMVAAISADDYGFGFLAVLDPVAPANAVVSGAQRERLDALAALAGIALRLPGLGTASDIDDERNRIARDLHDLAIQELFAIGMTLEDLHARVSDPQTTTDDSYTSAQIASSLAAVESAVAHIRQIVQSLRRERPQQTLTEQLHREASLAAVGLGFVPKLRLPREPHTWQEAIPDDVAEDVVAVVREGLANAARHAHASAVACSVSLIAEGVDTVVQVDISDNGVGIDPSVTRRSGLANMASRARRHNGWVHAHNLDPGTMISWRATILAE